MGRIGIVRYCRYDDTFEHGAPPRDTPTTSAVSPIANGE